MSPSSPQSLTAELSKLALTKDEENTSRSSSVDSLRRDHNRTMDVMGRNADTSQITDTKKETRKLERDRFVPNRAALEANNTVDADNDIEHDPPLLTNEFDKDVVGNNKRIFAFAEPPPSSSSGVHSTDIRLNLSKSTQSRGNQSSQKSLNTQKRNLSKLKPDRVLDAPGLVDDFYYNLLSWSSTNLLAVGIGARVFVWNADDGSVKEICNGEDSNSGDLQSLKWTEDGSYLATGWADSSIQIYDIETGKRLRKMAGHASRVGVLSWSQHILASGSKSSQIHLHDVRVQQHKVGELNGHASEVTGLAWKPLEGYSLASGGNDNVVNCWDWRVATGSSDPAQGRNTEPRWSKRNHEAAVKALAWCPWTPSLLASGGGTGDHTIHFWQSATGARLNSLKLDSQVTGLHFSHHTREILSTHGFPNELFRENNIQVHSYPSLANVGAWPAHDARVLHSGLSPDGTMLATGAGDEALKFWKVWESKSGSATTKKDSMSITERGGNKSGNIR
ncbi:WD40 repeat-like protein [Wallemia mellicola]|nr:WD40 repeat-like protein [Wallemia mellicola]TIC73461.1 WD40 repeat-like protein [Wallemia mellicola]